MDKATMGRVVAGTMEATTMVKARVAGTMGETIMDRARVVGTMEARTTMDKVRVRVVGTTAETTMGKMDRT